MAQPGTGSVASEPRIWLLDPSAGDTAPLFEDEQEQGAVPQWSPVNLRPAYFDGRSGPAMRVYASTPARQ
jgi:hypothetical protein